MKILLDTHIILWAISNDARLSGKAKRIIEAKESEVFYSIISLWEIELKRMSHPAEMAVSAEDTAAYCHRLGYSRLPLKKKHIYALSALKRAESAAPHKDPFDRMLICQAKSENMAFITHDARLPAYGEPPVVLV